MAAGLGFKTFNTGDVLSAADTNGYLMQGVLVFANATARDAAITSPQEGQCCYLKDTDAVQTYSGSAWVGFDDSNAIQNSIVDAKGDIVAASGNDTPARLAVGNNGETLVADSSTATGLSYIPLNSGGKNGTINGGFDIWQRGTSVAVAANVLVYTADRWQVYNGVNQAMTVSRQATGDTTNLPSIQYCARVQRNAAQTGTTETFFSQPLESANSIPLAGKTVTVSFYARKGANYSPTSGNLKVNLVSGTGTDQNITTYTGGASVATVTNALTTTWTRYTVSGTVGATATELRIDYAFTPTGTAGAADYFEVTGVQLEQGATATTFSRAGGTIQGELAACQRYFEKSYDIATALGTAEEVMAIWGNANAADLSLISGAVQFKVTKRGTPTITIYNTATGATGTFVAGSTTMTVSSTVPSQNGIGRIYATTNMGSGTYTRFNYTASSEL